MDTKSMDTIDNQNEIVCYCSDIGRQQIITAIKNGANTMQQIRDATKACTKGNCIKMNPQKRCCSKDIIKLIDEFIKPD
jgi:NAD(P)H-nitrite reductase large subunit